MREIDADGRYKFPVLPGKGILGFNAGEDFQRGLGIDTIDCHRSPGSSGRSYIEFDTAPTACDASGLNLVVAINPKPDDNELTVNTMLRSVPDIPGRVLSPDGQALADYYIDGAQRGFAWRRNEGETFDRNGAIDHAQRAETSSLQPRRLSWLRRCRASL